MSRGDVELYEKRFEQLPKRAVACFLRNCVGSIVGNRVKSQGFNSKMYCGSEQQFE